ncbi:hypothetical protein IF2G_08654 [Cordyceps javanica]|nr:hypothetical protein IF2G_08654 [Cordyceps javanica]
MPISISPGLGIVKAGPSQRVIATAQEANEMTYMRAEFRGLFSCPSLARPAGATDRVLPKQRLQPLQPNLLGSPPNRRGDKTRHKG